MPVPTRCPRAEERCAIEQPQIREVADGQFVACHFPLVGDVALPADSVPFAEPVASGGTGPGRSLGRRRQRARGPDRRHGGRLRGGAHRRRFPGDVGADAPQAATRRALRRSRLDPAERRAQIVEAAADVFRGRDPAGVRFEEVARAAGVSRSLVYAYFGDRGELIAAVYLHSLAGADEELSDLLADVPIDECRLGALVRTYLELAAENTDTWRLFAAAGCHRPPRRPGGAGPRQRIADTWGGGPAERLLARGLVGLLEAAASEWLEHGGARSTTRWRC